MLLVAGAIGGAAREQPNGGLIQLTLVLLEADNQVPSSSFSQFEHRRLGVKGVEQEDIKEAAAVKIGKFFQQTHSSRIFALSGLEPFDGQERLAGAAHNLAPDGTVVILQLLGFHAVLAHKDPAFEAGVATTTVAGEHLDAVQSGDDAPLHAARIERLVALERAVDLNQHPLQALHVKAGETVTQHVVAEGAIGADPLLQGWLSQFRFQLLKAGQPEGKTVKGGEEDRRRLNLWLAAGVGQRCSSGAEVENFVEIAGEGGQLVHGPSLPSHKCKIASPR